MWKRHGEGRSWVPEPDSQRHLSCLAIWCGDQLSECKKGLESRLRTPLDTSPNAEPEPQTEELEKALPSERNKFLETGSTIRSSHCSGSWRKMYRRRVELGGKEYPGRKWVASRQAQKRTGKGDGRCRGWAHLAGGEEVERPGWAECILGE